MSSTNMKAPTLEKENLERLLTTGELAELLRLSPLTLKDWRVDGIGPKFLRLTTGAVRYPVTDVTRWLGERQCGPKTKSE